MIIFPKGFPLSEHKECLEYCKKLEAFFGVNPGDLKIIEMASRKDFDKALGRKTPNWLVGIIQGKDFLILDRKKFETESTHKEDEFIQILRHEICHLFINELNSECSHSLEEGLCLNFAGQDRTAKISKNNFDLFFGNSNFYNVLPDRNFADIQGYQLSYMTTKNLLNRFSKKSIIQIIKIRRSDRNWQEQIEQATGMTIDEFINLMKNGILVLK